MSKYFDPHIFFKLKSPRIRAMHILKYTNLVKKLWDMKRVFGRLPKHQHFLLHIYQQRTSQTCYFTFQPLYQISFPIILSRKYLKFSYLAKNKSFGHNNGLLTQSGKKLTPVLIVSLKKINKNYPNEPSL